MNHLRAQWRKAAGRLEDPSSFDWYHGSVRADWLQSDAYVHVGTLEAAQERIDPEAWLRTEPVKPGSGDEQRWKEEAATAREHGRIYRVRLDPSATVDPKVYDEDDDIGDWYLLAGRGNFDVFRYLNGIEAPGSISLFVNPRKLRLVGTV